ncbi:MAG: hypothetical protein Q9227_007860 [Pyrenula ochraceoflavens]
MLHSATTSPEHSRTRRLVQGRAPRPLTEATSSALLSTHKRKTPNDETFRGRPRTRSVPLHQSSLNRSKDRHHRSQSPSRGTVQVLSDEEHSGEDIETPRKKRRTLEQKTEPIASEALPDKQVERSRSRDRSRLRMKYRRASEKASVEVAGSYRGELLATNSHGAGADDVFGDDSDVSSGSMEKDTDCGGKRDTTWGVDMRNREQVAGQKGETWLRHNIATG